MTLLDARRVAVALVGAVAVTGTPVHAAADDPAGAQQADRLEVQFGGGYVMPAGPTVRLGAWSAGATYWLTRNWGVAARHVATRMTDADAPRFERARSRNTASLLGMRSSSVTVQRRWSTAHNIEFQIGFGALLAGVERHAYFMPGAPPHVQDETSRGLAFELLAGRKVSRRIDFKRGSAVRSHRRGERRRHPCGRACGNRVLRPSGAGRYAARSRVAVRAPAA